VSSSIYKKLPKVLADKLRHAFWLCDKSGISRNDWQILLFKFRSNRAKQIAVWGITHKAKDFKSLHVDGLEEIPIAFLSAIEKLDQAYQALNHWRDGGQNDYITQEIINDLIGDKIQEGVKAQRQQQARNAASAKLAQDPKQQALKEIKVEYDAVKHLFKRHGYSAQFARDMHDKYPMFADIKTIKNLVTKLNKTNN